MCGCLNDCNPSKPSPAPSPSCVQGCPDTCKCTSGRKYVYGNVHESRIIGAKAKIKTRWGKLCCEKEGGTSTALSGVWVSIGSKASGALKWGQVGYSRRRTNGSKDIIQYAKAEMMANSYRNEPVTASAPAEGSVHEWKCELDPSTGTWTYFMDGVLFKTYSDDLWTSMLGSSVMFAAEIFNSEDDMAGTESNKVSFTECQYRLQGSPSYQDVKFTSLSSDDENEWGFEWVSDNAFNLWDKKPLP
jgi:hypothetical protein